MCLADWIKMRGAGTGILIIDSSDPVRFKSRQRINEGSLSTGPLPRYLPCIAYLSWLTDSVEINFIQGQIVLLLIFNILAYNFYF